MARLWEPETIRFVFDHPAARDDSRGALVGSGYIPWSRSSSTAARPI
jgi:hypothetical protein